MMTMSLNALLHYLFAHHLHLAVAWLALTIAVVFLLLKFFLRHCWPAGLCCQRGLSFHHASRDNAMAKVVRCNRFDQVEVH